MVLPSWLARLNRYVANPILGRVVSHVPGFGVLTHRGRRSGRAFRNPVSAFPVPGGYAIALTYGSGTQWVKNVMAAGECDLEVGGRQAHLVNPRVVTDPTDRLASAPFRQVLHLFRSHEFMVL